jgi:hypothetical protein
VRDVVPFWYRMYSVHESRPASTAPFIKKLRNQKDWKKTPKGRPNLRFRPAAEIKHEYGRAMNQGKPLVI